jgi:dTDP-4-amino-4,6-dideoxygalactose transaminase
MDKKIKVPYNYLPFEFKDNSKIFFEWKKLIKSTDFTLGRYMERFEKSFSRFVRSKYCISTNNGTDALILSLKSLGIKKDDEVITVCNTFYATVGAIVACGAKPIFVDCDHRYQIDYRDIENKISKKTKAIIPVHWGGASPEMKKIKKIADRYKIYIVEDACMGIGAEVDNKKPGNFGNVNAFSMHPLKSLNVMGDGGMIVTDNHNLYLWMMKYRNHGMIDRNNIDFWGVNMRLQPLQAIVAENRLKELPKVIKKRNQNAKLMDKMLLELKDYLILPERKKGNVETFALYMALFKNRDKLYKFLNENKIEVKIHYPKPLHLQKAAKNLGHKIGDFPIAEMQSKKLITLPIHQFINEKHIEYMYDKIKFFYKKM